MARLRLLPRDEQFFEFFEKAAGIAVTTVETLERMLGDLGNAQQYRQQIADLEHQGDSVIHAVVDKLNRTFITPLDPEDIRAIASRLDDVIDFSQGAAERLVLYRVTEPYVSSTAMVQVLLQTVREVQAMVFTLRNFSERNEILQRCIEINRLENVGDKYYREALSVLFEQGDMKELLRWKEIFEQIEQAIDQCEDLANEVESIIVKYA